MKKHLCVFFLLLVCQVMAAGNVRQQAARQKAASVFGKSTPLKLVPVAKGDRPAYYVFNAERTQKGFVIVSDDEIIGYSEQGAIDPQNMPPALRYWLECYEQQVALTRSGRAATHQAATIHAPIEPLVKSQWSQGAPFNGNNPVIPATGEMLRHTGCVATAMAQLLRYWAAPIETKDIPGYTYYLSENMTVATSDARDGFNEIPVEGLPATTFNYGIMTDTYSNTATGESAAEVARLFAYCGRSVKMIYLGSSSSASPSVEAFADYFGFNPNIKREQRSDYTAAEWDELVYGELAAGRPVLYSGQSQSATVKGGHSFICDGYRDGLYHINWGWGGTSDGYFKLSEANPASTGTGGGNSLDGYSIEQEILTGIQPTAISGEGDVARMRTEKMTASTQQLTRGNGNDDFSLSLVYSVYNATNATQHFDLGVGIYQDGVLRDVITRRTDTELPVNTGWKDMQHNFTWGSGISSGTFTLRNIARKTGTETWIPNQYSDVIYLTLTVNGNTLTITEHQRTSLLRVNSVWYEGQQKISKTITVHADITNLGTSKTNELYLFDNGTLMTGTGVGIDPGETDDVVMHLKSYTPGAHTLTLYSGIQNRKPVGEALWQGTLTLADYPEPNLSFDRANSTISNSGRDGTVRVIDGTTFELKALVTNKDTDNEFDDDIRFYLFKVNEGTNTGTAEESQDIRVTIAPGETQEVTASFEGLTADWKYFAGLYVYKPSLKGHVSFGQTYTYQMRTTGISTTQADGEKPHGGCYNLAGQRVTHPSRGLYIQNGRKYVVK